MNFALETKKEYTIHLINSLKIFIYEGIISIYDKAKDNSSKNELKIFQKFLSKIPKWDDDMINREEDRIIRNQKNNLDINELFKATIKSHIVIIM